MKRILLTIILGFILVPALMAQEPGVGASGTEQRGIFARWPNALGYSVGATGSGLSWQSWHGPNGLQITAGGRYSPNDYYRLYQYAVSIKYNRMLHAYTFNDWLGGNLYLTGMVGHQGTSILVYPELQPSDYEKPDYVPPQGAPGPFQGMGFAAAGVGTEIVLFEHLSLSLDYVYFIALPELTIEMAASAGLYFRY